MPAIDSRFDRAALVDAVYEQPIGLEVSTTHPEGFRRLMYLYLREHPDRGLRILACPSNANAFWLVRDGFTLEEPA